MQNIKILYYDKNIIILNKPFGIEINKIIKNINFKKKLFKNIFYNYKEFNFLCKILKFYIMTRI
ncbi:hypothetical protein [Candidatus Carsonella ruddii]|uniref:hypothetical protein n=1 Tax=Carsonella ruddii TaxID=114186 RepID=UPI0002D42E61|nr:hypothetical protein [Candidatus Carsonella ruddii]